MVDEAMFVDSKNDAQGTETASPNNYTPEAVSMPQGANFEPLAKDDDLPF
jgi:hypothetical protein